MSFKCFFECNKVVGFPLRNELCVRVCVFARAICALASLCSLRQRHFLINFPRDAQLKDSQNVRVLEGAV